MKVTQGETKDRQTILHIEVDDELVEQHLGRAHQKVAARVNVPGFRKGKAPRTVVERFVGKEYLLEEAMESLVPAAVGVAVEQEGITASATPRVSIVEREPVVKIDATVPLPPEATLGDYQSIRVEEKAEEVTDEQVEESVDRIREAQATWDEVDRAVKAGDLITFSVNGTIEGEPFVEQTDSEYPADADNPNPVPGFSAELVGIKPGSSKEFSIEIPADFPREELAGKTVDFTVSVSLVKEKNLPELTDESVKELGEGIESVADLRSRIRENLEARSQQALRESLEEKVVSELVELSTFELSPIMIEHEAEHVLYDQQSALAQYNISMEQYLAQTGQTGEQLLEGAKETAENRVKRTLVMDLLAESEGLEPTDEEIDAEIEVWRGQHAGHDHGDDPEQTSRENVSAVLKRRKAVDRAIEIAQSNGAKPAAKKTSSKKSSKKTTASKAEEENTEDEAPEEDVATDGATEIEAESK